MKINNASVSAIINRNFNKNDIAILINKGVVEQELVPLILNLITTRTRLQNLLRLYTYENSTLYIMNQDNYAILQISYGKDVKEDEISTGFQKIKDLANDIFKNNILTYEVSISGVIDRKLKQMSISLQTQLFDNPKMFGYRIISGSLESQTDIRYANIKEIILEPIINNINQTLISVTFRDTNINENIINSIFQEVNNVINYFCE